MITERDTKELTHAGIDAARRHTVPGADKLARLLEAMALNWLTLDGVWFHPAAYFCAWRFRLKDAQ